MANTIQDYATNALMSQAAYAEFSKNVDSDVRRTENIEALTNKDIGLTLDQAESFLNEYSVVYQYPNDSTGLSFTIFEDKSGHQTLAIRGTESLPDYSSNTLLTLTGVASDQTLALFNALQVLRMPAGTTEFVQAKKFDLITQEDGVWYGYDTINGVKISSSQTRLVDGDASSGVGKVAVPGTSLSDTLVAMAGALGGSNINITGHSLGGHLAKGAYHMLGDSNVGSVYTYNAPGIDATDDDLEALCGGQLEGENVFNLKGSGWDIIAGWKDPVGGVYNVYTPNNSHSIQSLVDMLTAMQGLEDKFGIHKTMDEWNELFKETAPSCFDKLLYGMVPATFIFDLLKGRGVFKSLDDIVAEVESGFNHAAATQSPLILDLNGDGVGTIGAADSGVYFDHGGDGMALFNAA